MPDRVTYFVDGTELFSATSFIPQGSMQANIIAWGPAPEWPDAYSAALQPTNSAALNQRFVAAVDHVSVSAVPELSTSALALAGLAFLGLCSQGRKRRTGAGGRTA